MDDKMCRVRERETVETERSRRAADYSRATGRERFPRNVERYINPTPDSYYAWEYAYSLLGDVHGKVVLDLGCGGGENSYVLALRGAKVIGIDVSPDLIALARQDLRSKNVSEHVALLVTSAHALPLADHSIDVVLGMAILHHLDIPLVSREVHRVLRPDGTAIFVEPVRESAMLRWIRSRFPNRSCEVSQFEHPLSRGDLREFSQEFKRFSTRHFALPHIWLAKVLRVPRPLWAFCHRLDRRLLRFLPFLRTYASVQVFQVVR
jgi:SAM-dependent methyltransferase